jgi:hypothetical protein
LRIERSLLGSLAFIATVNAALWNLLLGPARAPPITVFVAASLGSVLILEASLLQLRVTRR